MGSMPPSPSWLRHWLRSHGSHIHISFETRKYGKACTYPSNKPILPVHLILDIITEWVNQKVLLSAASRKQGHFFSSSHTSSNSPGFTKMYVLCSPPPPPSLSLSEKGSGDTECDWGKWGQTKCEWYANRTQLVQLGPSCRYPQF